LARLGIRKKRKREEGKKEKEQKNGEKKNRHKVACGSSSGRPRPL
jgi:hypothetical protein